MISFQDIVKSASPSEWLAKLLATAEGVKLKATAWQEGSMVRSILVISGYALSLVDSIVSGVAQGGFLDYAASGTISYTDASGVTTTTPVTPEGGPGFLDILVDGVYNEQRVEKASAGGVQAFTNTSGATYGPLAAGTLHVSNPSTKIQYSTTQAVTIPPSPIVGTSVVSITNYFGQIQVTTSTAHALSTGAVVTVIGALGVPPLAGQYSARITVIDATSFALDGTTWSGSYTGGAVVRAPTTATVSADTEGSVGSSTDASGVPATNTVTQLVTNLLGVTCANVDVFYGTDTQGNAALAATARLKLQSLSTGGPKGAYEYYALAAVKWAATLAPPLRLGAPVTRVKRVTDPADGTVYVFIANAVGASSSADVGVVDQVLQAYATPDAVTSKAVAATNRSVSCAVTVWLPIAYVIDTTRALFQAAIQAYFTTLPIGGVDDPQGSYTAIVPLEGVAGAIFDVAEDQKIRLQNVAVLLNGVAADLQLVVNASLLLIAQVAVLTPAVPTVTLVGV